MFFGTLIFLKPLFYFYCSNSFVKSHPNFIAFERIVAEQFFGILISFQAPFCFMGLAA